jgi:hypothetical protein
MTDAIHDTDYGLPDGIGKAVGDLERGNLSTVSGLVASASSDQAGATPLTAAFNRVGTVGTAGDSVLLPPALKNSCVIAKNATASTSMDVFPSSGDKINALSADAAYAVAGAKTVMFLCAVDGQWDTLLTG